MKIDIIYFNCPVDSDMETAADTGNSRLMTQVAETKQGFLVCLRDAVARSNIVFTVGGFCREDIYLPKTLAKAVGLSCCSADAGVIGIESNETAVVPQGSYPLFTKQGQFGGCILISGNQSIIMLSEDSDKRIELINEYVVPFIKENHDLNFKSVMDNKNKVKAVVQTVEADTYNETAVSDTDSDEKDTGYTVIENPAELPEKENTDEDKSNVDEAAFFGFEEVKSKPVMNNRLIKSIIAILLVMSIAVGGYLGYYLMYLPTQADTVYVDASALYGLGADVNQDLPLEILDKFGRLYSINADVVGWVSVPNTSISYPVVKTANKSADYYNIHLYDGSYNRYGTPYTNADIKEGSFHRNIVIYSKNTKDGRMFSNLENYLDINFYKSSPIITLDTIYFENDWKIFSVFEYEGQPPIDYSKDSFFDNSDFMQHLKSLSACSQFSIPVDVNEEDEIITLVAGGKTNVVVAARKMRGGEDSIIDVDNIAQNPSDFSSGENSSGDISPSSDNSSEEDSGEAELPAHMEEEIRGDGDVPPGSGGFIEQPPPLTDDEVQSNLPKDPPKTDNPSSKPPSSKPTPSNPSSSDQTSHETSAPPESSDTASDISSGSASTVTSDEDKASDPSSNTSSETPTRPVDPIIISVTNQYTGKVVTGNANEIIASIIEAEMGSGFHPEALKAQSVACYSWLLCNGAASGSAPGVPMKTPGQRAIDAAKAVVGERVLYNGKVAQTYYFAISAGYTANCDDIWYASLPYLVSVDSSVDKNVSQFQTVRSYKAEDVRKWISDEWKIDLKGVDKKDWFKCTYDENNLYVETVKIGDKTFDGPVLRSKLFTSPRVGSANVLRSSAYTITYNEAEDEFTFVVKGYGHGVGMSQVGANAYAKSGWDYKKILQHYYTGVSVG